MTERNTNRMPNLINGCPVENLSANDKLLLTVVGAVAALARDAGRKDVDRKLHDAVVGWLAERSLMELEGETNAR